MNLKYKKSNLVEGMGYKQILPTFYGKKPQNIKLTESQFKRLVEGYMEDDELYEMNLGDDDGGNLPPGVDDETDNFNQQLEECGEDEIYKDYTDIDHSDRGQYDGRKSRVVGVDSDIYKQRELEEGEKQREYLESHLRSLKEGTDPDWVQKCDGNIAGTDLVTKIKCCIKATGITASKADEYYTIYKNEGAIKAGVAIGIDFSKVSKCMTGSMAKS